MGVGGGYIHLPDTYIHIPSPLNSTSQTTFFKKIKNIFFFHFFIIYFFSCCFLCIFFNCSKKCYFAYFLPKTLSPQLWLGLVNSIQPDATIERSRKMLSSSTTNTVGVHALYYYTPVVLFRNEATEMKKGLPIANSFFLKNVYLTGAG